MPNFCLAEHQWTLAVHEECHPLAIMSDGALVTKAAMWLADISAIGEILIGFVRMHPWPAGLARAVWNNQSKLEGQLFICSKITLACEKARKCWTPVLLVAFQMLQYLGAKVLRNVSIGLEIWVCQLLSQIRSLRGVLSTLFTVAKTETNAFRKWKAFLLLLLHKRQ